MVERDEEGCPKATRNAGAFLGPFVGMLPVPTDVLDDYWRRRRRGRHVSYGAMFTIAVIIVLALCILIVVAPALDATAIYLPPARP